MTESNDLPIDDENAAEEPRRLAWYDRRHSIPFRIVDRLASVTGGRIRSPYLRSTEAFYRNKDAKENAEIHPADNQHFRTWAVWAVEAYTPANISGLLKGLESLKPSQRGNYRDPVAWVREQRNNPSSTFELYLFPPGRRFHMTGFQIELPEFACGASGTVWSATPSLTILTMFFILTDDERCRLDRIIRAAHTTRIEPHGVRSAGISHPELERRRLIAAARSDWSSQASRWIRKHFPGLLSLDERGLPTCELTVAEGLAPFPSHHENPINAKIVDALKWRTVDTFIPSDEPEGGLFYAPFADWDRGDARYSLVAMTRQTFESQNVDGWGSGDERFVYPFDRSFRHVIAQWAITHVLAYYRGRIALTRDMLVNVVRGQGATRALGKVREQTAECADAATVARDVVEGVADHSLTIYHASLVHRKRRDTDPDRRMDVALRETLTWRGNGLLRDVSELNATLHAQAALLSAHANLRLQPWIILLAIVSAFAGAIAAVPPARDLLAWLHSNPEHTQPSQPSAIHRPRHAAPSARPSAPVAPVASSPVSNQSADGRSNGRGE